MYKCKQCGKEFPVPAWIEIPYAVPLPTVAPGVSKRVIKKPCCPFCYGIEIEEIAVKTT